ncbi:MAG: alpha/beta hydrolase [Phormidesmis sp.]
MLLGVVASTLTALPAFGSERIQFFFGPFEPTVYVEDLSTFAETGEVSERFRRVENRLNDDQKENLRSLLNARIDTSAVAISQFTYSPVGEQLLQKAGQVIRSENNLNGMKAIRAGLIFAAADSEEGLTLINILRQIPLDTIQVDRVLAQQILSENQRFFQQRDQVVANLKQVAEQQSVGLSEIFPEAAPQDLGSYSWEVESIPFQNPGREVTSIADAYYPNLENPTPGSTPVVLISHGLASDRKTLAYLAEHLASHGYAVFSLEHAETSAAKFVRFLRGLDEAPDPHELLLRPRDITAILDTLTAQQATDGNLSHLNLDSVGLLGQSFGGYTVLAAGGATINRSQLAQTCQSTLADRPTLNLSLLIQCRILELPADEPLAVADSRVAAVIALNPFTSSIFGQGGLEQLQVPVMLAAGTNDFIAPALPEQIEPFEWLTSEHKDLVIIENGTHFSLLGGADRSVLPIPDSFIGPDPVQARPQIQALGLAFFNRHLQNETESDIFLSQRYLSEFPTDPFQFSLIEGLPD